MEAVGQWLVTGSTDGSVRQWDATSGEQLRSWEMDGSVMSLCVCLTAGKVSSPTSVAVCSYQCVAGRACSVVCDWWCRCGVGCEMIAQIVVGL